MCVLAESLQKATYFFLMTQKVLGNLRASACVSNVTYALWSGRLLASYLLSTPPQRGLKGMIVIPRPPQPNPRPDNPFGSPPRIPKPNTGN